MPTAPLEVEIKDNEIIIPIGNRSYRIRGLAKNTNGFDSMKVNVLARKGEAFFVDTLDIYAARGRNAFIKEASRELALEEEIIKRDLGKVLLKLEELQDSFALANIETKKIEITEADKAKALELLKSDRLIERILADFDACGVIGEQTNKLFGYIAATSRKLDKPLAMMVQSSSAAGKSSLMDAVLGFMPPEEQISYSAMTGQSLFYMGGMNLKNKILAISEEEGIRQAAYALKLLQSDGKLTIASTGKDPGTGRMETQEMKDICRQNYRNGTYNQTQYDRCLSLAQTYYGAVALFAEFESGQDMGCAWGPCKERYDCKKCQPINWPIAGPGYNK
jgi:hypothetical protein